MIVSVDELNDFMSNPEWGAPQRYAAELAIAGAQAEVEEYLNRPVELQERVETVYTEGDGAVWLSATPVRSVVSVVDPSPGALAFNWVFRGGFLWYGTAADVPVTVTYVGGLDGPNEPAIRLTVLRVAAREMQNRHDDALGVKDLDTADVDPLPLGLQDEDRLRISRRRRRTVSR